MHTKILPLVVYFSKNTIRCGFIICKRIGTQFAVILGMKLMKTIRLVALFWLASLVLSIPTAIMTAPTSQLTHECNERAVTQSDGSIAWEEVN